MSQIISVIIRMICKPNLRTHVQHVMAVPQSKFMCFGSTSTLCRSSSRLNFHVDLLLPAAVIRPSQPKYKPSLAISTACLNMTSEAFNCLRQ